MFAALVRFSTRSVAAVLAAALLLAALALRAFTQLPIEAYPDVTDPMVEVVVTFPGQAAEEVERRVAIELERVLAGTPRVTNIRTVSVFGLALCTLRFEDGSIDKDNRAQVAERLREAALPEGTEAVLGPQATPVGQIYRYTLHGPLTLRELRALQDFVIERRLRAVPGVADVVTFGGFVRQYQVRIDPQRLAGMGLAVADVFAALERTSQNAGGGYVGIGSQEFVVRGLGTMRDPSDIGDALVAERGGVPIRVRDVADVIEGSVPRRGAVGRGEDDEVVEGIVLLRRGENPSRVLEAVRARVRELNERGLPAGVRLDTFYDRGALIDATVGTVGHNLLVGAALVIGVLWLFLRTLRGALIVALVIPLSLGAAFLGLHALGRSANLISLGAIDFGILVDGAVVVLEACLHGLALRHIQDHEGRRATITAAGGAAARPVGLAMLIIVAGLVPIFTLERVEGRIFAPMAYTYVFALLGALAAATTVVPALAVAALPARLPEDDPRWLHGLRELHRRALRRARGARGAALAATLVVTAVLAVIAAGIGSEFLPELNEGGLYITAIFPSTISLDATAEKVPEIRRRIRQLPEVRDVLSQVGRPEDAPQVEGPNNAEIFVVLAPPAEWRPGLRRRDLEEELRRSLREIPGVQYNFSQPITDRVYETISGIIGQVVVKVRGADLDAMVATAEELKRRLGAVPGVTDLALYQAGAAPQVGIELDRERLAQAGLTVSEAQQTIEIALGGKIANDLWQGERRFGIALRLPDAVRADPDALGRLVLGSEGHRASLAEVADIRLQGGRSAIWREGLQRFVALKFNVRGRDLGSAVAAAQAAAAPVPLPEGVTLSWGGEFENQRRAMARLGLVLPLTLSLIVSILYLVFRRLRPALLITLMLPIAAIGAVAALRAAGENFSVSGAVGCIALLGQVALGGVLVCSRIDEAAADGGAEPVLTGAAAALRPVLLTTTLAVLGLLPAALSTGMGSETQRPFAIALIGGLLCGLPPVLLLLPLLHRPQSGHGPGPARVALGALVLLLGLPRAALAQDSEASLLDRWLREGREVAALRAQAGAARLDVVTAGTLPNPELALSGSVLLQGVPPDGRQNLSLQLGAPLPVLGQRAARIAAAERAADVAAIGAEATLWERAAALRGALRERALQEARVQNLAQSIRELAELERALGSRVAAGVHAAYDALRIRAALATLRADRDDAEAARDRAELQAVALLSVPGLLAAPLTVERLQAFTGPGEEAVLIARALSRRPDLRQARASLAAARALEARLRREALPTPGLWIGAQLTRAEDSASLAAGLTLPLPILDRNQGPRARARGEAEAHAALIAALEARVRAEVSGALRARDKARAAAQRYREGGLLLIEDLRQRAGRAYQAGAFSIAELLDAYRAGWEARAEALDLERAQWAADTELWRALGAAPDVR